MDEHLVIRSARILLTVAFLIVIFATGLKIMPECRKAMRSTGMRKIPSALHAALLDRFPHKYMFVDFNGGACRAIGRRLCNERFLFCNGFLGYMYAPDGRDAVGPFVESTVAFAHRVEELDIPFLYVQIPSKFALEEGLMPEGWMHYNPNDEALRTVEGLAERGVRTLSLVQGLAATRAEVEANFFRTDHHWRGQAAFRVAELVAHKMANILEDQTLHNPPELNIENWEKRTLRQTFLGSHGRRTGRWFAGIDDFEYFIPKFVTNIQRYKAGKLKAQGNFKESVLEMRFLSRPLHDRNAYGVYGTDRNDVAYVNKMAKSRIKVLVVKDSFANPVVGFLSTVCREIVKVDPRRYTSKEEIFQTIAKHRPDIVVMLVNPTALRNEKFILMPTISAPAPKETVSR